MKTVYIDGYFFGHELIGGISRMWGELIKNALLFSEDIRFVISANKYENNLFFKDLVDSTKSYSHRLKLIETERNISDRLNMLNEIGPVMALNNRLKVKGCRYDVNIFHSSYMSTIFPKIKKIPNIVTVHDLILQKFKTIFTDSFKNTIHYYMRLITENFTIRNADHLIAVSDSSKNDLIEVFGLDENKISVIRHGISEHWFLDPGDAHRNPKPYFLFVGGRNPYKNYNTVLRSLARLQGRYRDLQLIAVGENHHSKNEEKNKYKQLGISERVVDLGVVDDKRLKSLYKGAVAFIVPSLYEGFGFPLLESLACGCPVLASDIPANREMGRAFVNYFPAMNDKELAALMIHAFEHGLCEEEKEKSRAYARTFNWQSGARSLLDVYGLFS